MAVRRWRGGAPRVAQVQTFTFAGTWEIGDLIRVTVGGKAWDYAVTSATIATFLPLFVTAYNALSTTDYPEFGEITASAVSPVLTFTGDTTGKPFVVTLTPLESNGAAADAQEIEGAGIATTGTAATACSGPNFWDVAANWKETTVPITGDDVTIDEGPSILYGTDQNAVTLATLTIGPNYPSSSEIGLPANTNPANPGAGYSEYRQQRLKIGATSWTVETNSRRVRLDVTPAATTGVVRSTGQAQTAGEDALDVAIHHAAAALHILKGSVGVNYQPGDTGTVADLNVSFRTSRETDARVRCGAGLTLTNLDQSGGEVYLQNGATTVVKTGGTLTVQGAVGTSLKNYAGTAYLDGTGTITLLENGGACWRRGLQALTITTLRLFAKSRGGAGEAPVTYTNAVEFYQCRQASGPDDRGDDIAFWDFGRHKKYTAAAI
jgi:hypothetical protein